MFYLPGRIKGTFFFGQNAKISPRNFSSTRFYGKGDVKNFPSKELEGKELIREEVNKMKSRVLLSILVISLILVLVGCGVVPPLNQSPMEDISFENRTANVLSVQITSTYIETSVDSFIIEPDATITISSTGGKIPSFNVSVIGQPSLKVRYSEYNHLREVVFWNTFEYKVEYKISGTAKSVSVTLSNPTGGTEQYSDVSLPKTYCYHYFPNNFLYISAQNNGSSGTVRVKCYYKGQLKDSAYSEGAYVIATASYYISNY